MAVQCSSRRVSPPLESFITHLWCRACISTIFCYRSKNRTMGFEPETSDSSDRHSTNSVASYVKYETFGTYTFFNIFDNIFNCHQNANSISLFSLYSIHFILFLSLLLYYSIPYSISPALGWIASYSFTQFYRIQLPLRKCDLK